MLAEGGGECIGRRLARSRARDRENSAPAREAEHLFPELPCGVGVELVVGGAATDEHNDRPVGLVAPQLGPALPCFGEDVVRDAADRYQRFEASAVGEEPEVRAGHCEVEAVDDVPAAPTELYDARATPVLLRDPARNRSAPSAGRDHEVGTIKAIPGIRTYVAVDGGMSDNPRPVLYGSGYEAFLPRAVDADRPDTVTIVGKHCESGDVLVRDAALPADLVVGDILGTAVTGAYGHSMGSNYNKVPRTPVVFAADGDARLVVRRETFDDLTRLDL